MFISQEHTILNCSEGYICLPHISAQITFQFLLVPDHSHFLLSVLWISLTFLLLKLCVCVCRYNTFPKMYYQRRYLKRGAMNSVPSLPALSLPHLISPAAVPFNFPTQDYRLASRCTQAAGCGKHLSLGKDSSIKISEAQCLLEDTGRKPCAPALPSNPGRGRGRNKGLSMGAS